MLRILMHPNAYDRVAARLAKIDTDFQIMSLGEGGVLSMMDGSGAAAPAQGPDICWLSVDAAQNGQAGAYFDIILQGGTVKWVQTLHAGLDNPAYEKMLRAGVRLCNSDAQAIAIAEYVFANVMALNNPIAQQRLDQDAKSWQFHRFRELAGGKWMIIGHGNIGREVAQRAKAFGVHITGVRRATVAQPNTDEMITLGDIPSRLGEMDVVLLSCALNDATRRLVDADFLGRMKESAILVNIGRGGLIDHDALRNGLDQGQLRHAVLDVFDTEPLPEEDPLWSHPKISVTAHCSNAGSGTTGRWDDLFVENLGRYMAGKELRNPVSLAQLTG